MTEWRNWAGDEACRPARVERPRSVAEIGQALERANDAGETVRPVGAGHSFGPLALTDGVLLSLENLRGVVGVDVAAGRVRVEGGATLREIGAVLLGHGLAFENLGDIDVQTIAGATATGTHGTGAGLRNLSAALESIELVCADGTVRELGANSDEGAWRAARVGLGALGVVSAVTLRAVPAFVLEGVDRTEPLDEVLESLDERSADADHFELYSFPHSDLALTRTNNRVEGPARPRIPAREWLEEILLRNHVLGAACRLGRARPQWIPAINRAVSKASGASRVVDRSQSVFASPRLVRFTEMEYALPRARAAEAVRAVRALIDERGFAVPFPLELRFVAPDDALLSPAGGRETAYVAVHMLEGMEWEPYFRAVEAIMDGLGGRPHWGKRHFQDAATLAPRYAHWDRFAAVRGRLDPDGRFANPHLDRVLGPVAAPAPA